MTEKPRSHFKIFFIIFWIILLCGVGGFGLVLKDNPHIETKIRKLIHKIKVKLRAGPDFANISIVPPKQIYCPGTVEVEKNMDERLWQDELGELWIVTRFPDDAKVAAFNKVITKDNNLICFYSSPQSTLSLQYFPAPNRTAMQIHPDGDLWKCDKITPTTDKEFCNQSCTATEGKACPFSLVPFTP